MAWHPAKISSEAHQCLKLAAALTNKDMRDIASEAILTYCKKLNLERMRQLKKRR